ncbi:MAG: TusE/DsrC/DsvC family sulfur relay protein [Spongiibacteraceae bacterium]|jgi:tRNA 2-thiouridine synthesizing protein E|nr:TusE/DsrC/DsvC family sulfur relay protein [Spongiibacteraceae bacterium]
MANNHSTLLVEGDPVELDDEGYLLDFNAWNRSVAEALARQDALTLTPEHWEIIELLRLFYQEFQQAPAMRALVKYVGLQLGADKGNSIHLLRLFPGSPARRAARIAGLPRPEHCL